MCVPSGLACASGTKYSRVYNSKRFLIAAAKAYISVRLLSGRSLNIVGIAVRHRAAQRAGFVLTTNETGESNHRGRTGIHVARAIQLGLPLFADLFADYQSLLPAVV